MTVLGTWHTGVGDAIVRYLALWMGMPVLGILHMGWDASVRYLA